MVKSGLEEIFLKFLNVETICFQYILLHRKEGFFPHGGISKIVMYVQSVHIKNETLSHKFHHIPFYASKRWLDFS